MHVHVFSERGEAKFWLSPRIELARNFGMSASQIRAAKALIEEHKNEICDAWQEHFGS
jgi:protein-arginine kinase